MCNPVDPIGCAVQGGANSGLQALADSFSEAATWALKQLVGLWLHTPSPDVTQPGGATEWLSGRVYGLVLIAALISVLWAAYKMATSGQFSHLADLAHTLIRLVIVAGVTGTVVSLALLAGDEFADWMMAARTGAPSLPILAAAAQTPDAVRLVIALVVVLVQFVQFSLMLLKNAAVIVLVALVPVAAAGGNTGIGNQSWQKMTGWLAAFVLYKPAAALIYALSFKLLDNTETLTNQMSAVALMIAAIFALPALMRLLVPVTRAASGGNAGAVAGAAVGAAAATGAVIATGGAAAGGFAAAAPSAAASSAPTGAISTLAPAASGIGGTASSQTEEAIER